MLSQARRRVFGATHSVRYGGHFRFRGQRLFIRNAEGESCPDGYGLGCQGGGRGGAGELWAVHHACGCRADRKSTTSELQSLMRISYAVFCLKNKTTQTIYITMDCAY